MTGEAGINYLKAPIGGDAATADKQQEWQPHGTPSHCLRTPSYCPFSLAVE